MEGHGFLGALTGQGNEFINCRIFVHATLLAVVNAHRCMGGFFPGKKNQFLMGQRQMLGNKSKACSGQSQVIGFTGSGTEDVVQLIIDGNDMMTTGEYMLQKIGRNVNNLAVRPHIFRGDAFSASLFACQRQRMIFPHDTDKGIVMEFLEGNVLGSKFCILDAQLPNPAD